MTFFLLLLIPAQISPSSSCGENPPLKWGLFFCCRQPKGAIRPNSCPVIAISHGMKVLLISTVRSRKNWVGRSPTSPFKMLEFQGPSIDVSLQDKVLQFTEFEALKLLKGSSGKKKSWSFYHFQVNRSFCRRSRVFYNFKAHLVNYFSLLNWKFFRIFS